MPNDNSYEAQIIRNDLAKFIYKKLTNSLLIQAINTPDHLKYFKKKEMSNALSLYRCNLDYSLLNNISWMPSGSSLTESLIEFVSDQNVNVDKNLLNTIKNFVTDPTNKHIINPGKSIYLPLEEEKRILKGVLYYKDSGFTNTPKELNDFISDEYHNLKILDFTYINFDTEEEWRNWGLKKVNEYQNKKIGNIGEYYQQLELERLNCFSCYVSKDCGDGFGYDHLSPFMGYENLYETKSTLSTGENDSITISENEYNTMLDCLGSNYSNYYIARLFIDRESLRQSSSLLLKPQDDKLLVPCCDGPIYKYDHDDGASKVFIKQ